LIAFCCNAVATSPWEAKSIHLCQAAVLAGYSPSDEELQHLQFAAASENTADGVLEQLVNWLNKDRQQVPSLLRHCRVAIRQQLSVAAHHQTILPAIHKLPLPNKVKLYLQFDGPLSEVDLSVNKKEETSAENSCYTIHRGYMYDVSDFDNYYGYDPYDNFYVRQLC